MSTPSQVCSSSSCSSLSEELEKSILSGNEQEAWAEVLHDVRNLLATVQLYCDLLAEPEALAGRQEEAAVELRVMLAASSRLIAKLAAMSPEPASPPDCIFAEVPIEDLAVAVREISGPLAALAGPKIRFEVECLPCPGSVLLAYEDLTRILINLTRNAAEAMPQGGCIRVTVQQGDGGNFLATGTNAPRRVTAILCVQDSGPGIPDALRRQVFDAGFTTKTDPPFGLKRGLGLSIVRSLVESAGGCVRVCSAPGGGTRMEMELPLIHASTADGGFPAAFPEMEHVQC